MDHETETDPKKVLAQCPVKMKPITSFFKMGSSSKSPSISRRSDTTSASCDTKRKEFIESSNCVQTSVERCNTPEEISYEDFIKTTETESSKADISNMVTDVSDSLKTDKVRNEGVEGNTVNAETTGKPTTETKNTDTENSEKAENVVTVNSEKKETTDNINSEKIETAETVVSEKKENTETVNSETKKETEVNSVIAKSVRAFTEEATAKVTDTKFEHMECDSNESDKNRSFNCDIKDIPVLSDSLNEVQLSTDMQEDISTTGSVTNESLNIDKSTPSIMNFFSKQDKPKSVHSNNNTQQKTITIRVDVHPEPIIEIEDKSPKKKFSIFDKANRKSGLKLKIDSSKKSPRLVSPKSNVSVPESEFDDSIIVIDQDQNTLDTTKKRATKAESGEKDSIKLDVKSKESKQEDDTGKRQILAAKLSSLDNVKMPNCKKNVQATLQFGGTSFKLAKTVKEEPTKPANAAKENASPPKKAEEKQKVEVKERVHSSVSGVDSSLDSSMVEFTPKSAKTKSAKVQKQKIELKLELGHRAIVREASSSDGHSHDWTVFVRAAPDSHMQLTNYVQKVVFSLHETYRERERVVTVPPFGVKESGYGGFDLPVCLHFHKQFRPKTQRFVYDLFLMANESTNNIRQESVFLRQLPPKLKCESMQSNGEISAKKLLKKARVAKMSPPAKRPMGNKTNKLSPIISPRPLVTSKQNQKLQKKRRKKKNKEHRDKENVPHKEPAPNSDEVVMIERNVGKDEGTPSLRRSSRRSAIQALNKIIHQDGERTPVKTVDSPAQGRSGSRRSAKRQRRASSDTSSPDRRKKPRKLAPIFCKKSAVAEESTNSDADSDVEIVLTEEARERQRVRQAFLMSGVPEALRKQTQAAAAAASVAAEYPPWPLPYNCHVQQISESWEWSQENKALNLRSNCSREVCMSCPEFKLPIERKKAVQSSPKAAVPERPALDSEAVQLVLSEIACSNPSYPARRVYSQLLARRSLSTQTLAKPSEAQPASSTRDDTQKSKKRKLDEDEESSTKVRKRRKGCEDAAEAPENRKDRLRLPRGDRANESSDRVTGCAGDDVSSTDNRAPTAEATSEALLWTDRYSPSCMSEVLGKAAAIRKLHAWLHSWKQVTDLEMRRMAKELEKQERKNRNKRQAPDTEKKESSDLSDFESEESGDSEFEAEEDMLDGLCNTMLIQGPHGVGKTSLVYALANQLHYKVFEVNASRGRTGRQVLQQLQEATQSHQVTNRNLTDVFSTILATGAPAKPQEEKSPKERSAKKSKGKGMTAAFNSLFGKKTPATETSETQARPLRRKRRKSSDDVVIVKEEKTPAKPVKMTNVPAPSDAGKLDGAQKKGLDLASCSLILFEEVDVVLEEDRGFWAAIQTFMNTTKRPIILTTTSHHFLAAFDPKQDLRVEQLTLKFPKQLNTVSYLQLVCLAEGLRTDCGDIQALVEYQHGDIRQALLTLQLWAESGGCRKPVKMGIRINKADSSDKGNEDEGIGTGTTNTQETDVHEDRPLVQACPLADSADDSQNSEDDFEVPKRKSLRVTRRAIIEDDSSRDSLAVSENGKSEDSIVDVTTVVDKPTELVEQDIPQRTDVVILPVVDNTPLLHQGVFKFQFGITDGNDACLMPSDLSQLSKQLSVESASFSTTIAKFLQQRTDILSCNMQMLLPLPKKVLPLQTYTRFINKPPVAKSSTSRIKNRNKLYDSDDTSEDEFLSLKNKEKETEATGDLGKQTPDTESSVERGKHKHVDEEEKSELGNNENAEDQHGHTQELDNTPGTDKEKIESESYEQKEQAKSAEKAKCSLDNKLLIESLDSMAQLSDMFSFCDSHLQLNDENSLSHRRESHIHTVNQSNTTSGLLDQSSTWSNDDPWKFSHAHDIVSHIQVTEVHKQFAALKRIQESAEQLDSASKEQLCERLTLPVETESSSIRTTHLSAVQQSLQQAYGRALENVQESVMARGGAGRRSGALDYMPTLRAMSRAEQLRKVSNTKRRYLHYFDLNHINLRSSTLDTMNSSFL